MIGLAYGLHTLTDVSLIDLPRHSQRAGQLVVAEQASSLPFAAVRMFTVTAPQGAERGRHAHRLCSQFMICVHGAIDIVCEDGRDRRGFVLDRGHLALFVPPTIWTTVIYRESDSVLAVLCDRPYEPDDYIRDYAKFLNFRANSA
jgi:dTDP-4-dehydrorhamnose 3,5-epimerase-like enzyme